MLRFRLLGFGLLSLLLANCATDSDLNALDAPSREQVSFTSDYPSVIKIVSPGGRGMCTGTFVSPRAVMTAAHCTLQDGTYTIVTSFGNFMSNTVVNFGPGTVGDPNDLSFILFPNDVADASEGQVIPLGETPSKFERIRLVGYGCNDIESRLGAGFKRTGTNQVYRLNDYIELATPLQGNSGRSLVGPENRAGSCFGDSGGPMFRQTEDGLRVVGVAHAGSWSSEYAFSQYIDLNRYDNIRFMRDVSNDFNLELFDVCRNNDFPSFCNAYWSYAQIASFLRLIWRKLLNFF